MPPPRDRSPDRPDRFPPNRPRPTVATSKGAGWRPTVIPTILTCYPEETAALAIRKGGWGQSGRRMVAGRRPRTQTFDRTRFAGNHQTDEGEPFGMNPIGKGPGPAELAGGPGRFAEGGPPWAELARRELGAFRGPGAGGGPCAGGPCWQPATMESPFVTLAQNEPNSERGSEPLWWGGTPRSGCLGWSDSFLVPPWPFGPSWLVDETWAGRGSFFPGWRPVFPGNISELRRRLSPLGIGPGHGTRGQAIPAPDQKQRPEDPWQRKRWTEFLSRALLDAIRPPGRPRKGPSISRTLLGPWVGPGWDICGEGFPAEAFRQGRGRGRGGGWEGCGVDWIRRARGAPMEDGQESLSGAEWNRGPGVKVAPRL